MHNYPVTSEDFMAARNRGYYCRHPFKGLLLTLEESYPAPKDHKRLKRTYWCEQCKGIKYAILQSNGVLRSWKNG